MTLQTREQAIVAALAEEDGCEWSSLESRAEALPAMLLRHGALPVKLFLESKGGADATLWRLVEKGIHKVLPEVVLDARQLAQMSFETYLLVNDVATETAALLARWVKVHTAKPASRAEPPASEQEGGRAP